MKKKVFTVLAIVMTVAVLLMAIGVIGNLLADFVWILIELLK